MSKWLNSYEVALLLRLRLMQVWRLVEQDVLHAYETPTGFVFLTADVLEYQHRNVT